MPHNPHIRAAGEALEAMGFECIFDEEDTGLVEYWLPGPPHTVVVLHDSDYAEQRFTEQTVARQLDDAQMTHFRELTGW